METGVRNLRYISIRWPSRLQKVRRAKDKTMPCLLFLQTLVTRAFRRGVRSAVTRHTRLLRKSWQSRSCRESRDVRQAQSQSRRRRSRGPEAIQALPLWRAAVQRSTTTGNVQGQRQTIRQKGLPGSSLFAAAKDVDGLQRRSSR